MACDKIVGYTDFTAQQSVAGYPPTPEAELAHDIEGVDDCGNAGILMGQSSYNLVQQDLRDGIIRMPAARNVIHSINRNWEWIYGADTTSWPNNLKNRLDRLNNIKAELEVSYGERYSKSLAVKDLIAALQDLRLYEETMPAFEAGMNIVAPDILRTMTSK